jgi:hypothetical protein
MNDVQVYENEFEQPLQPVSQGSLMSAEAMKGVAEVQAAVMMAKRFPRDQFAAFNSMMQACSRRSMAESAVYAYPRGGKSVSGPSIRLAECMAKAWGNLDCGIRELSRDENKSVIESYAWDLESNCRWTRVFEVEHRRDTKGGSYKLTDARDIYENVANQGARRLRACILEAIPGDVVEKCVAACKKTMTKSAADEPFVDQIRKIIAAFSVHGVTQAHIEARIGHSVDIITAEELFDLHTIYNSIKDGLSKRSDFFDIGEPAQPSEKASALQEKLKGKA